MFVFVCVGYDVVLLFEVVFFGDLLSDLWYLVVVNLNNLMVCVLFVEILCDWYMCLYVCGGLLIVDEVFIEVFDDGFILVFLVGVLGLVVLCLIGKFYGLVGVCIGFVLVVFELVFVLCEVFGYWIVNGFVCVVVCVVLVDIVW